MGRPLQTPEKWYEGLKSGKYKDPTAAKRSLGKVKWGKPVMKRAHDLIELFYRAPEQTPPFFHAGENAPPAKDGAAPSPAPARLAKKNKGGTPQVASPEVVQAHSAEARDRIHAHLRELTEAIRVHVDIIDGYHAAHLTNPNCDTSELQGVVNTLTQPNLAYQAALKELRLTEPLQTPSSLWRSPGSVVPPPLDPGNMTPEQQRQLAVFNATRPPGSPAPPMGLPPMGTPIPQ